VTHYQKIQEEVELRSEMSVRWMPGSRSESGFGPLDEEVIEDGRVRSLNRVLNTAHP
jgi:hypothetical protein